MSAAPLHRKNRRQTNNGGKEMAYEKRNIRTLSDLAKLPWFEADERGIRVRRDADLPPVIDAHTHLGFSYGFSPRLDLKAKTPEVKHFRDFNTPRDILYALPRFSAEESEELKREFLWIMVKQPARARTHTLPNQVDEMDRSGIGRAVSLPIEIPFWPRHSRHTLETCKGQDRVIPFAGVHPWDPDPRGRLEWFIAQGCRGMKYHPEFQFHPPDTRAALKLFGFCEEMDVVVLSHSGSTGSEPAWIQRMSELRRFRVIFKHYPKLRFVLGHCGIKNVDEAIAYNREFPNIWLETSGQPVPVLRKVFKEADTDRLLFGSDWPFTPMVIALARALIATEDAPELRRKLLSGNAARLLDIKT
jgi:uncharacterized protein